MPIEDEAESEGLPTKSGKGLLPEVQVLHYVGPGATVKCPVCGAEVEPIHRIETCPSGHKFDVLRAK